MLIPSSFGDSFMQTTADPDATGWQVDCHRSANVDIAGGRTGLLSSTRSNSNMTFGESRGKS